MEPHCIASLTEWLLWLCWDWRLLLARSGVCVHSSMLPPLLAPVDSSWCCTEVGALNVARAPFAGVPEGATYVHVMYVYRDPSDTVAYDDSIEVNFKLPSRDED